MNALFHTIGLIGKHHDPGVADTLENLVSDLGRRGLEVLLDESAAAYFRQPRETVLGREQLADRCDLVIVVGGDGTMLNAARSLAEAGVAMLGINLGRLGFLADVSPADMHERLDDILAGHYREEYRSLLHASVCRHGNTVSESDALNDVVIHKWDIARMIELDTWINGQFLNTNRSDGRSSPHRPAPLPMPCPAAARCCTQLVVGSGLCPCLPCFPWLLFFRHASSRVTAAPPSAVSCA